MTRALTETPSSNGPVGRWVLAATILASSMVFIQSTAINVALPAIQADLGATGAQLLWVVNGYLLTLAALILVGGSLGDKLGRKRVCMCGIGLFLAASLACGLVPSVELLIAARIVQGVGAAVMIPGSLAIAIVGALVLSLFADALQAQAFAAAQVRGAELEIDQVVGALLVELKAGEQALVPKAVQ